MIWTIGKLYIYLPLLPQINKMQEKWWSEPKAHKWNLVDAFLHNIAYAVHWYDVREALKVDGYQRCISSFFMYDHCFL